VIHIRPERPSDVEPIRQVNLDAFGTYAEANLVDALRHAADPIISLVAEADGVVVGHIMFSPVTLSSGADLFLMGLAPMSVAPDRQRQGIGSALVVEGLDACRRAECSAIVVLGHSHFYPRFGFVPASRFGLGCEYNVPSDVFMALELIPGAFRDKTGTARYHAVFDNV